MINRNIPLQLCTLVLLFFIQFLAPATRSEASEVNIVINEIMYHPPTEFEGEEYIELYNQGKTSVDVSGWKFTKGIVYTFPPSTIIEPNGYLVVCRVLDDFQATFGNKIPALGNFFGTLRNSGERVTLSDHTGETIDSVKYVDRSPWPVGADGYSASLERVCPTASGEAINWASAPLPADGRSPTGTPGRQNATYSVNLPPTISNVTFQPANPKPDELIIVQAKVIGKGKVTLLYRVAKSGHVGDEVELPMWIDTEARSMYYKGVIPAQPSRSIVRFRIRAIGEDGALRFQPHPNEPRPAYSVFIDASTNSATISIGFIVTVDDKLYQAVKRDEEQRRHQMAMAMLESGTNLEPTWLYHTLEQELNNEQMRQLRSLYREKFGAREKWIAQGAHPRDRSKAMSNLPHKIKMFNEARLQTTKTILTAAQYTQFLNWREQNLDQTSRFRSRRRFRRSIGLETSWFFLTTTFDLSRSKFEELKLVYTDGFKTREQVSFRERRELNDSVTNKAQAVLSEEQQARFNQWWEEKSPRQGSDRFRRRSPGPPTAERGRERRRTGTRRGFGFNRPGPQPPPPSRGKSAFVYISPDTGAYQIFDYVNVTPRAGGYKVRFHKDRPLNGMTTINLIFEDNPRFVLAEHLSYEVYRRSGVPTEHSEHIRISLDDYQLGYYLLVEQPNRNFLRRHKRDDSGNLYKILWYEQGVVDQHEKKTNFHTGHDDIVNLVSLLDNTKNEEQWEIIKRHFNVEEVINYFAVNLCISNWDGFFNNYFTYHNIDGSGKWEIYPWDEDKTWGYYDGGSGASDLYDMPLTFGMSENTLSEAKSERGGFSGWGRLDQPSWWRPPGYFSGPLLSNPQFRERFLIRLKEITATVYTESVFLHIIDDMAKRLVPEVRLRAEENGQDVDVAMEQFRDDIESLQRHLVKRREFILSQDE